MARVNSAMRYLRSNPIQELRRILRDQYSVDSILKELVQNADDAGARKFHLSTFEGWRRGIHPLLIGPALLVLNDGEFREIDKEGISRLDEGAKGGDSGAIGKYGLGMKSLFHLCEGVFYAASANQAGSGGDPLVSLLNPWEEGGPHDDWSNLDIAAPEILRLIERWRHGCERWFCLLIPLRLPQHLAGAEAIVQGRFPSLADVESSLDLNALIGFTPLLRTVQEISIWEQKTGNDFQLRSRATVDGDSLRRAYGSRERKIARGQSIPLKLSATDGEVQNKLIVAAGTERLLDDVEFDALKRDPRWPKNYTWDPHTGRSQPLEKGEPHGAVVLSRTQAPRAAIEIIDAVFLPLTDGSREQLPLTVGGSYELLLHGQFFLDAGRRSLYAGNGDKEQVQERWNDALLSRGVLPLIPQALYSFKNSWKPEQAEVRAITGALQSSNFFRRYKESICSEASWLPRIDPDLTTSEWQLTHGSQRYFEFPSLDGRAEVARRVFPGLDQICGSAFLVEVHLPRLTSQPPRGWSEDPEVLEMLLESIDGGRLAEAEAMSLLTEFLRVTGRNLSREAVGRLAKVIRRVISETGVPALQLVAGEFRSLLAAIPARSWVSLGPLEEDANPIFKELNRLDVSAAVIPAALAPDDPTLQPSRLSVEDAEIIVQFSASTAATRSATRTASLALRTIEATGLPLDQAQECFGNYNLWLSRTGAGKDEPLKTWHELGQLHERGRLFGGGSPLLSALHDALRDKEVYSLYSPRGAEPFQTLFGLTDVPNCDAAACINLLYNNRPRLADPVERVSLLEKLKSVRWDGSTDQLAAIRYLLHGSPDHADDIGTDLLTTPGDMGNHLARVAEEALRRLAADWRWVDEALWRGLTQNDLNRFGVTPVDVESVEQLLYEAGTEWIEHLALSEAEADRLLADIRDPNVWRSLPLHKTVAGRRISLDSATAFLTSDYEASSDIRSLVTLLKADGHPALRQKYLDQGIREWGAAEAIDVALDQEDSASLFFGVLDAIHHPGVISPECLNRLRKVKWLVTRRGEHVAPGDVVVIEGLEDYLQSLLANQELKNAFVCFPDLDEHIRHHPAISQLRSRKILPDRRASAELLAMCLAEIPEYHIGPTPQVDSTEEGLELLLRAFAGVDAAALPTVSILRRLTDVFADDRAVVAETMLPVLRGPLPFAVLVRCLEALGEAIDGSTSVEAGPRLNVMAGYVKSLFSHPNFGPEEFREFKLPNQLNKLVPLKTLAVGQQGIAPSHLLHPALLDAVTIGTTRAPELEEAETDLEPIGEPSWDTRLLIQYLRQWEGRVPKGHRGALLALFGDDEDIVEEAGALLSPKSVLGVRTQLKWVPNAWTGIEESVQESMGKQRFAFVVADDNSTVRVMNLIGEWFAAPVGGTVDSIFVGSLWWSPPERYRLDDYRSRVVTLRAFDLGSLPRNRLMKVLRESARILLKDVYAQEPPNLGSWWEAFSEGGQLALDIVQEQLLGNAWFYFQQLGDRQLPSLRALLREHEELNDRRIELRKSSTKEAKLEVRRIDERLELLPTELKQTLMRDVAVQTEILGRIRSKMADYQYSAESVPFELFQNADDASAELVDMVGTERAPRVRRAELVANSNQVSFRHWGRPINEFSRGAFPPEKGRQRGYDKDLKKMLILGSSDKGEREDLVTGKFGLGFKSVFFLSDRPRVISGDLSFEVVAGFYPTRLPPAEVDQIRAMSSEAYGMGEETIVSLAIAPDKVREAELALRRFADLLPLALIFSRAIREFRVVLPDGRFAARLHEAPVTTSTGERSAAAFVCHLATEGRDFGNERFLVLRTDAGVSLCLNLRPLGVERLPPSIPACWVGAPTGGRTDLGFCLNAPFDVDVGRNQLAESEENRKKAIRFGKELGRALLDSYDAGEDWANFQEQLGLLPEVDRTVYWESIWAVLSTRSVREDFLLGPLLCNSGAAMDILVTSRAALPSHLPPPYAGLTQLGEVKAVVRGRLDHDQELADHVLSWPNLQHSWDGGSLVSDRRTWSGLSDSTQQHVLGEITFLGLAEILANEVAFRGEIDPAQAEYLGRSITREYLFRWDQSGEQKEELREFREALHALKFRAADGSFAVARDLVAGKMGGDEGRRADFAPPDRVLDEQYSDTALRFFSACREALTAETATLERWARVAESRSSRIAALAYILHGDLGRPLADKLRSDGRDGWYRRIPADYFLEFSEDEQLRIRAFLARDLVSFEESWTLLVGGPTARSPAAAQHFFAELIKWWDNESTRQDAIAKYEAGTWPVWLRQQGVAAGLLTRSDDHWLALLVLGATRSLGRSLRVQHRAFLELLYSEGWWDIFSSPEDSAGWMDVLRTWQDRASVHLKYARWMSLFPAIHQFSRHLKQYQNLFVAAERNREASSAVWICRPRVAHQFTGAGQQFDAPPLPCGIGFHWVLRELVRMRVLQNDEGHLYPDCWVPSKQVVDLLGSLGFQGMEEGATNSTKAHAISKFIAERTGVSNAHFHYAFDIPLRVVAKNGELRRKLGLEG
jgi:hypothetical protein